MHEVERPSGYDSLLSDIVALVEQARAVVLRSVNTVMTAEHWSVGHRRGFSNQRLENPGCLPFSNRRLENQLSECRSP